MLMGRKIISLLCSFQKQPIDQHIDDVDVDDAVDEKRIYVKKSKSMLKWLVQTLHDNNLAMLSHTCFDSHHAS